MTQRRSQKIVDRDQTSWKPACLDDHVSSNDPVHAIDAWVGTLNLKELELVHTGAVTPRSAPLIAYVTGSYFGKSGSNDT